MSRAIFLDRDGVVNKSIIKNGKPYPPPNIGELEIYTKFKFTINEIKKKNYLVFIITNQPDVGRGTISRKEVKRINGYIKYSFDVDEIYTCYCSDNSCPNRKPNPGFLLKASKDNLKLGAEGPYTA